MASPRFSVIVATHERPAALAACLAGLAALERPRAGVEVIVVDDGGTTPLGSIIDAARSALDVTLLRRERGGPAAARNAGARHAQGEYLAFIDDDCRPAPDWLCAYERAVAERPGRAVGGPVVNALSTNLFAEASQLLITHLYDHYNVAPEDARFLATNNLVVPRAAFEAVAGFDVSRIGMTAEDRDLVTRLRSAQCTPAFVRGPVVYHYHDLGWWGFWRQHFGYGRGTLRYHRLHAANPQRTVPTPGLYVDLLALPFARYSAGRALRIAFLLALSQVATLAGMAREALHQGVRVVEKR